MKSSEKCNNCYANSNNKVIVMVHFKLFFAKNLLMTCSPGHSGQPLPRYALGNLLVCHSRSSPPPSTEKILKWERVTIGSSTGFGWTVSHLNFAENIKFSEPCTMGVKCWRAWSRISGTALVIISSEHCEWIPQRRSKLI